MGWENMRARGRTARGLWDTGDLTAAIAVHAAQLPAAGLVSWLTTVGRDRSGSDDDGGPFGFLCLLVFAPLLLPLLGMLVSVVLTLPAVVSARLAGRRLGGPDPAWRLAGAVATAAGWAAVTTALWHWPFATTAAVLTALGVLPALVSAYVRTRPWTTWGLWWRSSLGCAGLVLLVLAAAIPATVIG
ncbi:hypothetical protein JK359_08110 [Streptomyces actinomycinicus]|uniref:Uncharacterized protein n=1 Tax=Streptomyces actinomycinicus TaxID=1695166 RepID=A0A937EGG9_9ACTN|nr:hypothetical protein [Streptomyces actinomycinicus]MBL1081947.1 hypothetical protein [Streptomyces actinomycinicus]